MNDQRDFNLMREVRKELVGIAIARLQNIRQTVSTSEELTEPEKKSPKAVYGVEESLNNPYINRDEVPLAMDIFKPVVPEKQEMPAIVVIHGGGLIGGERASSRLYSRSLASRGYLVFNIEYRHAPRANACEQLDDVCAGLDYVGRRLVDYDVDISRIFLTAISAGAYLAVYVAAMKQSKALQEAIGYKPTRMIFKALGLHGGMYYTNKKDPIGFLLADQIYGDKILDNSFRKYLDPEHREIINNLPPVFLTTSRGDWLNNYTLMYHQALKKAGRKSHLLYMGDSSLGHACVGTDPNRAPCIDAIDKMCDWFEKQAEKYKIEQKRIQKENKAYREILTHIDEGKLIGNKSWYFIKELNSFGRDRLNSLALVDGEKEFSYRQMFTEWERYARVFSALGISGKNGSRVALPGRSCSEGIFAFYGLNMTGASTSVVTFLDQSSADRMEKMIQKEGITDIIVDQVLLESKVLTKLLKKKNRLGIRNVIAFPGVKSGKARNRMADDLLYMDDLLIRYEDCPVDCIEFESADAAVIVHTSGTTKGIQKPIPLSDEAFNEAVARFVRDKRFDGLRGRAVTMHTAYMSSAYCLIDGIHLPFAFGGTTVLLPVSPDLMAYKKAMTYSPNIIFVAPKTFDLMKQSPFIPDFSSLEYVFCGGEYFSAESREEFNQFLRKCGSKVKVTPGYGLSEMGAACIVSHSDREDDAMGYPLSGVKVKIFDEEVGSFHELDEGSRMGILYLSSRSMSSGFIDNKVFFKLEEIEGEKYYNTNDLVRVNEDGSLTYIGRANKYFVNNEGIRFEAGLVEAAVAAEPGIEACGMVPGYNRKLHDTFPILYVKTKDKEGRSKKTVEKVLTHIFVERKLYDQTNLPGQCVITDHIPYNENGKVDVHRILSEKLAGTKYKINPVRKDGELIKINLLPAKEDIVFEDTGVPRELEKNIELSERVLQDWQDTMIRKTLEEECPILGILDYFVC